MLNLVANGPSGYNLTNSLRFRSSASAYLSRTMGTPTSQNVWTYSTWVKIGSGSIVLINSSSYNPGENMYFGSGGFIYQSTTSGGLNGLQKISNAVYRDNAAWYHVVVQKNAAAKTSTNAIRVWVNNQEITSWATNTYVGTQSLTPDYINVSGTATVINQVNGGSGDGYTAETNFIDGQALTPSSFGSTNSTTGVWQPAKYTGTYGTNGFYLKFSNIALTSGSNTGLGQDFSGNGNYWNTNNISVTAGTTYDAMTDVPTLTSATVANYAVLNPLDKSTGTISNGNLFFTDDGSSGWGNTRGTFGVSSGKWYWEITISNDVSTASCASIASPKFPFGSLPGQSSNYGITYYANGSVYYMSNAAGTAYGNSFTTGDVIGVALDMDNGKIWFSKNGTFQASGDPVAGTNAAYSSIKSIDDTWFPIASTYYSAQTVGLNFGQQGFKYTPPTGYVALNTYNLPTSTIVQGNKYMDATTYTGTGATLSVTNAAGFKPDFVWVKDRQQAQQHLLFDSVRGVYNFLSSNLTAAEGANSTTLTSFNTNGFGLGTNGTSNQSGISFVGWQWQAGQGSSSSNTNGSITSTVSVNASAGFSVITYAGANTSPNTIGHGLGVAPKLWIIKNRSSGSGNWVVNYIYTDNGVKYMFLNATTGGAAQGSPWSTLPTSSVITLGGNDVNTCQSGSNYVCYAFAEISGFSKIGYYTANGSTDGPFNYLGFRPKFVMIKNTNLNTENWLIIDSSRDTYNVAYLNLWPNSSSAETNGSSRSPQVILDLLSNGFKLRGINNEINSSTNTYMYMAFAENPFKNALAR